MENQITINLTGVIVAAFSLFVSIFSFFILRMVKGYDGQIKEIFERTEDLPAIRTDISWIKDELQKDKK